MEDLNALWEQVVEILSQEISSIGFSTYITSIIPASMSDHIINLIVPSDISKRMIDLRYKDAIKRVLLEITHEKYDISVVTQEYNDAPVQAPISATPPQKKLIQHYTFDNFIVGNSNNLAYSAAVAVAEAPAIAYNPLFIWGGVGLGKTHLLHAIGNYIEAHYPNMRIALLTAEDFTNELIKSIKTNTIEDFRDRYRSVDVLLVDDVQFIGGKAATEEEMFHTFNTLYQANKQIVYTSDMPPKSIPNLTERLATRFSWDLVCDLTPPNFETRMAILTKKVEQDHIQIDTEILYYVATEITTNIRDLEGAFATLLAYQGLTKKKLDMETAKKALQSFHKENLQRKATPELIIKATAKFFNVTPEDIVSKRRTKELVDARQTAMYLCKVLTNMSFTKIGELLKKDRTTIMYGIKKMEDEILYNEDLKKIVDTLIKDIQEE